MGSIFKVPAGILYVVGGIWGLIVSIGIITSKFGALGGFVAFFLLPFTLYLAPWYVGFVEGNWFPVLLVYGTTIGSAILFGIGAAIDRD